MTDGVWQEAASLIGAEADRDLRADARELFRAEAARVRMVDLRGDARLTLRCGLDLSGRMSGERIADHLVMRGSADTTLVPVWAIVRAQGLRSSLRNEAEGRQQSIGSWLRERWETGEAVRVLDVLACWHVGPVVFVGADHVRVTGRGGAVTLPFTSVDAWVA